MALRKTIWIPECGNLFGDDDAADLNTQIAAKQTCGCCCDPGDCDEYMKPAKYIRAPVKPRKGK